MKRNQKRLIQLLLVLLFLLLLFVIKLQPPQFLNKKPSQPFSMLNKEKINELLIIKDKTTSLVKKNKLWYVKKGNVEMSITQYTAAVGSEVFEGCLSTNLPSQMTESFKNAFKQEYNADAGFFSDYSYDTALILKFVVKQPKSNWTNAVQALSLTGASGEIKFDENGTRFPASEVHIFRNGAFEKI